MRLRILALPIAAVVIAGLVMWKQHWLETHRQKAGAIPGQLGPAPSFVLLDQHGNPAKLERYLGRTRVVLFFTGSPKNVETQPEVQQLAELGETLKRLDAQPIVVTPATPFAIREAEKRRGSGFPFPVVTDIGKEQILPAHRLWGRMDAEGEEPLAGLFLIDRAGRVAYEAGHPRPERDPAATLRRLGAGEWPGS
jgi:peroxiredoxin